MIETLIQEMKELQNYKKAFIELHARVEDVHSRRGDISAVYVTATRLKKAI